ncbi:AMP-binding protein [Pseudohoeflea coraliihabitans]|uniref:AMP-binding protein n=1 Tax=Pseudohoeflea coraliihabitans TaxID=2860393 RepID=A0ABS6WSQ0_9HYPH|nr:AMP-binding protein [Pseudohoeflea sp. DP4N28-3]MBW3098965.1 AMP-binding protein [Pseudohoeflea sp. DP4N28-3]
MTSTAPADPRIPARDDCVLGPLLEKRAAAHPDRIYAVFEGGLEWSYARTLEETRRTAAGLQALGLKAGQTLLIALPNGPDALRVWFAANYLGAIAVNVNPAYRGALLQRVIENSQARIFVAESELIQHINAVERGDLETLVVFGTDQLPGSELAVVGSAALDAAGSAPTPPEREILPFETQCIIYTSGTTGPSKGVMCSYLHIQTAGKAVYFLTGEDRYLVNLPVYHVAGILPCMLMLWLGGSVAVIERFRTGAFWQVIAETKATFAILLGVMTRYLLSQPECPEEKLGHLRHIIQQPLDEDGKALRQRFGFDIYTSFNMTEVSLPIVSGRNPVVAGMCGRARDGVELRIVDEWDCEVADGETGELIIRTDQPWAMTHGYFRDAEATARSWRNGWFHTGDVFRKDDDGNYYFVDRLKDTIRRRGENISSFEVETALMAHPAVREAAAVAVDSEISESEVMAVLSLVDGATLDPVDLIAFLRPRLAYFMIPRFVRVLDQLPKTPTGKIEKHVLRSTGLSAGDVWDRDTADVKVRRG